MRHEKAYRIKYKYKMIMTDDILLQQLRELKYPGKVDVTEAVMAEVRRRPLLVSKPAKSRWGFKQISVAVAACAVLAVGLRYVSIFAHQYDSAQIADDIATVYDYHAGYAENNSCYEAYLVDALLN